MAKRPVKLAASTLLALLVNLVIFAGMAWMNRSRASHAAEPEQPVRLMELTPPPQPPIEPEPVPVIREMAMAEPTVEPMTTQPIAIDSVPLTLEVPTVSLSPVVLPVAPMPPATPQQVTRAATPTTPQPAPRRTGPRDEGEVDRKPQPIGSHTGTYPSHARRQGIEGRAVVRLLIDEEGVVQDVQWIEGDAIFRSALLRDARRWRFTPAQHEGRPVAVWKDRAIDYQMEDR